MFSTLCKRMAVWTNNFKCSTHGMDQVRRTGWGGSFSGVPASLIHQQRLKSYRMPSTGPQSSTSSQNNLLVCRASSEITKISHFRFGDVGRSLPTEEQTLSPHFYLQANCICDEQKGLSLFWATQEHGKLSYSASGPSSNICNPSW